MTKDEAKIEILNRRGLKVLGCTPDEWLTLAIEAEDTLKSMSPFDPAYMRFTQMKIDYMDCAELAERLCA